MKDQFSTAYQVYFTSNVGCIGSPPAKVLITVTPVNDAPVLAAIGNKTVKKGVLFTFTATDAFCYGNFYF